MQRAASECLGVFALVVVACASMAVSVDIGLLGVALAQGLILAAMIAGVIRVSGAHFNPAVTLGLLLTFFLVWVVFAVAVDPRRTAGAVAAFAIGLVVTVDILVGGPITGAAMNPARAFGPQLVFGVWDDAWIYYAGPFLGGAVAALLHRWLLLRGDLEAAAA